MTPTKSILADDFIAAVLEGVRYKGGPVNRVILVASIQERPMVLVPAPAVGSLTVIINDTTELAARIAEDLGIPPYCTRGFAVVAQRGYLTKVYADSFLDIDVDVGNITHLLQTAEPWQYVVQRTGEGTPEPIMVRLETVSMLNRVLEPLENLGRNDALSVSRGWAANSEVGAATHQILTELYNLREELKYNVMAPHPDDEEVTYRVVHKGPKPHVPSFSRSPEDDPGEGPHG